MRTLHVRLVAGIMFSTATGCIGPGNAATVVGGSDLLVGAGLAQIESWLVNDPSLGYTGPLQFTNIFDKGPSNSTAAAFHAAVDGKGPTIVLLEAAPFQGGNYQIIGGSNPLSWSTTGNGVDPAAPDFNVTPNIADRTAFIFNLTNADRRDQRTALFGQYQTGNHINLGPVFGAGNDLLVNNPLSGALLVSLSYCADPTAVCSGTADLLGRVSAAFVPVGQLEVFTIAEASAVPLPATLPLFGTGLAVIGVLGWRRRRKARHA